MSSNRSFIPGSVIAHAKAATPAQAPNPDQTLTASIVLRRPSADESPLPGTSREEIERSLSASPSDIDAVTAFARKAGLSVIEVSAPRRTIRVEGTVAQFEAVFGTTLRTEDHCLTYSGPLTVPAALDGIIVAVLGLDQRPIARTR
jgi:kumamolisin